MQPSRTRWKIQHVEHELANRLADQCGIHPLVARLLLIRGYATAEQIRTFLVASDESLYDPYLMDGMSEAVEAVRRTIDQGGLIRIYGDYDADGISSTSLMIWLMRELGASFDHYIPHRVHEGYGLNKAALDKAKQDGVQLIITVDTGISAYEEARYADELGLHLVITDHHEPPAILPSALAVLNPKKPGCPYPYKQLAGVGVAFKLAQALIGHVPTQLTELVALGTIADLMPLTGENRTLVQLGLKRMQRTSYVGLQALFHVSGLDDKEISAGHIGFAVAPRINASGRLTSADTAVQLLTTEHEQEAYLLAQQLDELNRDRQRIVEETVEEALQQLEERYGIDEHDLPPVLICSKEGWNAGVIGIAAARLLERFYRPTLVFTIDPESRVAKGSARSISGFDMYRALTECADLLEHYGGHQAAAGMSLQAERLPELQARLNSLASDSLSEEDYTPLTEIDICCTIDECTIDLIEQLEALAPYGIGNRSPRFLLEQSDVRQLRKIGKEGQHLKLTLSDRNGGSQLDAVGFGLGELHTQIAPHAKIDVIGELQINEWNGIRKSQLLIQDIRVDDLQVFDWRGLKPLLSKNDPVQEGQVYPGLRADAAFVICDSSAYWQKIVSAMFGDHPIVLMDEHGDLSSAEDGATYRQPCDLVLVQLPRTKQQLANMLATYGDRLQRICVWFADAEDVASGCPSRDRFKHIYAYLKQQQAWQIADDRLYHLWSERSGLSARDISFIVRVFEDLGFITRTEGRYEFVTNPQPRDLAESTLYQKRSARQPIGEEFMLLTTERLTRLILDLVRKNVPTKIAEASS